LTIFLSEAGSHVAVLQQHVQDGGVLLDDACLRALHTLAGSSGMAGVEAIAGLARSIYELAQALRGDADRTVVGEYAEFFQRSVDALTASLTELEAGGEAEEDTQLLADADHLLLTAEAHPEGEARNEARDRLLGLDGMSAVMDAPAFLRSWHDGALDLEFSEQLCTTLQDVSRVARETERQPIADLADALAGAHASLADDVLSDEALTVLDEGHERLLSLFDALAADQSLASVEDVVADLAALPAMVAEAADLDEMEVPDDTARVVRTGRAEAEDASTESRAARIAAAAEAGNVVSFPRGGETAGATSTPEDHAEDLDEIQADFGEVEEISLDDVADDMLHGLEGDAPDRAERVTEPPAPPVREPQPARDQPAERRGDAASGEMAPALPPGMLPEDLDEEIVEVFFEEADEILEQLDENVHQWAREPGNRLFLEHLLRGLHTLKGGARLAGLVTLGDTTHQLESFLIDVQSSPDDIGPELFHQLAGRFDELTNLIAVIKRALAGEAVTWPPESAESEVEPVPGAPESAGTESAAEAESEAPVPPLVTERVPGKPAAAKAKAAPPKADPAEAQEKSDQRASQEMVRVGSGLLENLVNLAGESSIVRARIEQGMSDFTASLDEMEITIDRLREQLRRLEIETEAQILFRQDRPEAPSYDEFDPLEMDRYSQLQQLSRGLSESASDMLDLKETLLFKARESETLLLQQARINTELQEGLMRTRMVPFSRLLPRLRRIVRQVSSELGKEVEFHAFNAEGELDRNLLERMVPPLEHMLRNAVDHGIESKELRKNYGKPSTGRIDLRLSREGGDVVIEISDDGAGIDVESVRAKAVERGLMAPGAKLRDDEICQFVLAPGFSTAKSVTQISGRGVGMDVVHSEVKQLGGSIQIASRQGKGTRFIVRVPFTVSVNRALMVSVGDDAYAIPLNTIEGIVLLTPEELERLYAPEGNTFEYAGIPYRVRYLGHYLGREFRASSLQSSVPVVLVRSGDHAVAVHVDSVQGSREIVVKSLGPQFAGVGGISGATILGDGSVVVILDLLALIRSQSSAGGAAKRPLAGASRVRCVMVVDDSVTVRKVTSRLLERQGMDVMVAKDGIEAISLLQERRPDVMLLDIEMPRMDGFEVARQVRHDERLSDLPIIMISSRTGEKHQEHAAQLGVNSFLGKPFQENELLATIDRLVH
jgi:chemosensory pili system protein ChpA (sensor histidine kinase/response regulator)